jgi:hypothetical protein
MSAALHPESMISRHPGQLSAEVNGEVLMMHEKSGNYFGLNPVASFIWQALSEPQSVAALCDAVVAHYGIAREICEPDVLFFIDDMIKDGLMIAEIPPS